jgi:hypothetical protein
MDNIVDTSKIWVMRVLRGDGMRAFRTLFLGVFLHSFFCFGSRFLMRREFKGCTERSELTTSPAITHRVSDKPFCRMYGCLL